jgi:hypothetical protein
MFGKWLKVSSVSRRKKLGRGDAVGAAKLMKPRGELNLDHVAANREKRRLGFSFSVDSDI